MQALPTLARLALVASLVACGGGGGSSGENPISGGIGGTGTLSVNIADAPIDGAIAAVIQFSGIALKRSGADETVIRFDPPLRIDLLGLAPGESAPLLPATSVDAGPYESMRLLVDAGRDTLDSHLTLPGGAQRPLFIPSNAEAGLRITRGFSVPPGGRGAQFTIDFDLRKSVAAPASVLDPYPLEPALRLVDNATAGAIEGSAGAATLANASCPFAFNPALNVNLVYVFEGSNVTPDDIDRAGIEPVATARLEPNAFGAWTYRAAFLPAGRYTVAFTCQGASEDPRRNDNLVFLGTRNVVVNAAQASRADF